MLECTLAAGLCSVGADVDLLGVIPTPGVAYLVRKYGADAGIVISASHNPMEFNGIKIFKGSSKARGSGIGLAVCEEIVTMHGGTITLENAEGGGTLVTISIPTGEE